MLAARDRRTTQTVVIVVGAALTTWLLIQMTGVCENQPVPPVNEGFAFDEMIVNILTEHDMDIYLIRTIQYMDQLASNTTDTQGSLNPILKMFQDQIDIAGLARAIQQWSKEIQNGEPVNPLQLLGIILSYVDVGNMYGKVVGQADALVNTFITFLNEADLDIVEVVRFILLMTKTLDTDVGNSSPITDKILENWNYVVRNPKRQDLPETACQNTTAGTHSQIFFLETSGSGVLGLEFLSSIESAARFNPDKAVQVVLVSETTQDLTDAMQKLGTAYSNIEYYQTTTSNAFKDTPLDEWYSKEQATIPRQIWSEALRLAFLWKQGGIYLDLDAISLKQTKVPRNFMATEIGRTVEVTNAAMAFEERHPFLEKVLESIATSTVLKDGPSTSEKLQQEYLKYRMDVGKYCDIAVLSDEVFILLQEVVLDIPESTLAVRWNHNHMDYVKSEVRRLTQLHAPVSYEYIQKNSGNPEGQIMESV